MASHDPDKGETTLAYNDAGDLLTTTDARGQTLAYTYDGLGRKTGEYTDSVAPANKLATWAYDPPGFKGQVTTASRWLDNGTTEYRIKVRSYTPLYQSTGEDYIVPAALTGLSGTYTVTRSYRPDGSPNTVSYPAGGGLGGEGLSYTYDPDTGLPETLQTTSSDGRYVGATTYNAYGEMTFVDYQTNTSAYLQRTFSYEDDTHRLHQAVTIRQHTPQAVATTTYGYDPAGNPTSIVTNPASGATDTQCFTYDYANRLTNAWTPATGDCNQQPSADALGGPAPYWQSWTFDATGDRATQTLHGPDADTTTNYTYPEPGDPQPHTLSTATTPTATQAYTYDAAGNTTCRPAGTTDNTCGPTPTDSQSLTWDAEGHLATVTTPDGTSNYTYTADGTRLVADNPTSTTLYLPGTELTRDKTTGTVSATRYITYAGQTIAQETSGGGAITWLINDPQGTQTVAVQAGSQDITTRWQNPYGQPRGTTPPWPNPKGFVSGDNDPTGLTHIGARQYDTATGRFLSVDPVLNKTDPQSWTGYDYAANNPITTSDPTGQCRNRDGDLCIDRSGNDFGTIVTDGSGRDITTADTPDIGALKIRHDAARDGACIMAASEKGQLCYKSRPRLPDGSWADSWFQTEYYVPGGSFEHPGSGNPGRVDIVWVQSESEKKITIWEVKKVGNGLSASLQLQNYADVLRSEGWTVTLGGEIAGGSEMTEPDPIDPTRETLVYQNDPSRVDALNGAAADAGRTGGFIGYQGVVTWWTRSNRDQGSAETSAKESGTSTDSKSWWEKFPEWMRSLPNIPVVGPMPRVVPEVPIPVAP